MNAPAILGFSEPSNAHPVVSGLAPAIIGFSSDVLPWKEEAFAELEKTMSYYNAVNEDFNRAMLKKYLDGKNAEHKGLAYSWGQHYVDWQRYYNLTHAEGISYANANSVKAKCVEYFNEARAYQEKLKSFIGADKVGPIPPEKKPEPPIVDIPGVGKGVGMAAAGLAALVVVLAVVTRK